MMNDARDKDVSKVASEDVSARILAQIKGQHIAPRPRWHFRAQEGAVWALGSLSIFVGGLAIAAILFEIRYAWWDYYSATHDSFFMFFADSLPLVWLVAFAIFAYSAYSAVRHTKRGYRYSVSTLLLASLVGSALLGSCLYAFGMGPLVDEGLGYYVPLHRPLIERERALWNSPDVGRVAGLVTEVDTQRQHVVIRNMDDVAYGVDVSGFDERDREHLEVGDYVRVIGLPFLASEDLMGCIILMKSDDILRRAQNALLEDYGLGEVKDFGERKALFARTTECRAIESYMRMLPLSLR